MSLNAYDLSAGLFVRGLTNLKTQLTKAEAHATAYGILRNQGVPLTMGDFLGNWASNAIV